MKRLRLPRLSLAGPRPGGTPGCAWSIQAWRLSRRAAGLLLTLFASLLGLALVTFFIGRLLPTDPVLALVGDHASAETYQAAFEKLRLDQPLPRQFLAYLGDVLAGDWGVSATTSRPVAEDIATFFPATAELAIVAIAIGVGLGLPLGLVAARHAGRWPDHASRLLSLAGHSVPVFWLGLVGLLVFYARLGWVGGPGRLDIAYAYSIDSVTGMVLIDTLLAGDRAAFLNALSHIALPGIILGLMALGYIARMTRAFLLGEMGKDYLTTARLKGLSEGQILVRHVLPAVAGPVLAVIAWTFAYLLEGAVLTETLFAWPGLGLYITQSLFAADIPAVLAGTLLIGVCFTAVNFIAEALQALLDPRTRAAA
ncbi:MAG: ABC transporter permease [Comamonas sp.]